MIIVLTYNHLLKDLEIYSYLSVHDHPVGHINQSPDYLFKPPCSLICIVTGETKQKRKMVFDYEYVDHLDSPYLPPQIV